MTQPLASIKIRGQDFPQGINTPEAVDQLGSLMAVVIKQLGILTAKGITLSENVLCDIVNVQATHGVAARLALRNLSHVGSAIIMGSDTGIPLYAAIQNTGSKQATATIFFNKTTQTANVTLLCMQEGTPQTTVPAWVAAGTVSSVGLTMPAEFSVSGSPITGAGTLAVTKATQAANTAFRGPSSGADAAPTFRADVAADIPSLDTSKLTTGVLPIARGGTNSGAAVTAGGTIYSDGSSLLSSAQGTATQVWTSNGVSAPTWQTSAGSSSGWLDAYTIDFTTQSTQDLKTGGDGAKTIAGKTFYVVGTAGSTTFGITNGTGLVMTRNTVDPEMYVRLVDLNSAINPLHDDIEIWYYFTPALPVVNNNLAGFGHYKYATSPSTNYKAVLCYRIETGALVKRQLTQYAGVTTLSGTSNANTTDTVFIDRIYGPLTGATFSTLDSSGAFPSSWGAFNYMGSYQIASPNEVLGTGYANPSDVAAYWTASSGASKLTLLKMKVRVRA